MNSNRRKSLFPETIESELLHACDEAFRNGVRTEEICNLLLTNILVTEKNTNKNWPIKKNIINKSVKLFRNVFWATFFISVPVLLVVLIICDTFELNPLYFLFSLNYLHDKQCLLPSHPLIMEIGRPISSCSMCNSNENKNDAGIIEFINHPSRYEFEKVAYLSKPVIIRGGARRNVSQRFNFETLKTILESEPNGLKSVNENCQFLPFRTSFTSLEDAFVQAQVPHNFKEPWYIGWSNCNSGVVAKLREIFPRPEFLPLGSSSSAIDWIFIGSPGYGAAMHLDYVRRPSWQAQLSGKKSWTIKPPPECENECPESTSFVIDSGDMIFLDTNVWYHETYILGNELSISIGSEYD